ncbi:glycosyltransferase [Streptomyces sp. NPDC058286]|uniref:glycosyltransferase n=1 Tax=Streptomyces sp. NPDC058286 TaxID=3346422 RepID=UPI0036E50A5F
MGVRIAAIVVSFNRQEMLSRCLQALDSQSRPLDSIIVIDNASDEFDIGSIAEKFNGVEFKFYSTKTNLGGAGGFAIGVDLLLSEGRFDYAWLMDDDATPSLSALKELESVLLSREQDFGFLASRVVTLETGDTLGSHSTYIKSTSYGAADVVRPAEHATFVGALVNLHYSKRTFLPMLDFFLWLDDTEYTSRLSTFAPGVTVLSSVISHPAKPEHRDLGRRLYWDTRNRIWFLRDRSLGARGGREVARRRFFYRLYSQMMNASNKKTYFTYLYRGLRDGIFKKPIKYYPGQLRCLAMPLNSDSEKTEGWER